MARNKPYTKKLAALDLILMLITAGGWILVVLVRELYRHQ